MEGRNVYGIVRDSEVKNWGVKRFVRESPLGRIVRLDGQTTPMSWSFVKPIGGYKKRFFD
jgi:hypothetical protein